MDQKHRNASISFSTPRTQKLQKELFKTLSYSDIFDYPLTGDQLFQNLGILVKRKEFISALKTIPYMIINNTIYYHLPKRKQLIEKRLQKEKWSLKKIKKATTIATVLSYIPSIRFIGISGSLALKNAEKNADTDMFFICAPYATWITRFLVYFFLQIMGLRRKRNKKKSDAICPNMFMDERFLIFPKSKRNVYIAHEIVQLLPLISKRNIYNQFLFANKWIKEYFPNIVFPKIKKQSRMQFLWSLFYPLEYVLYRLQVFYMQKHITRETITEHLIAFHPIDYEKLTLSLYNKKERKYGV